VCGIVGGIRLDGGSFSGDAALDALAHRGPDGGGEFRDGPIWLAHRRLAIIDLSSGAAQPMTVPGRGTIVFNGEIYDYERHGDELKRRGEHFETHSDTEVLLRGLALEGPSFLARLHGMYAFAWYDPSKRRLLLGRDHAGMKPLYYRLTPRTLAFASELRALGHVLRQIDLPPRISRNGIAQLLGWGAVPEPDSILESVVSVPADHVLEIPVDNPGQARACVVGRIPLQPERMRDGEVLETLRGTMRGAVARHLVADHPVALFLSAGIDSGVLACEVARASANNHAVSVVLGSRETKDEPDIVRRLSRRLGLQLHIVDGADWRALLVEAFSAYDHPSIDGLNTFVVANAAKKLGFRVALSGVGGDEVFGGYSNFRTPPRVLRAVGLLARAPRALRDALNARGPRFARRLAMLAEAEARGLTTHTHWRRVISARHIEELMPHTRCDERPEGIVDALELEQATYLRNTLLHDTDVMGMAHSVEIRAPYLDPGVLTIARRIGTARLLDATREGKWPLRDGWATELEPASTARRKTGFTMDLGHWLLTTGASQLAEAEIQLGASRIFDKRALASQFRRGRKRLHHGDVSAIAPLFALMQVDRQLQRWGEPV